MKIDLSQQNIENPFIPDRPARQESEFVGREGVLEGIRNYVAGGYSSGQAPADRPLVICGPEAIGRTSLLQRLLDGGLDAQVGVLYADFGVMDTSIASVFLWQLAKSIMAGMRQQNLATPEIEKRMLVLNPQLVFRQRFWNPLLLRAHSTPLLLAWDNFDSLLPRGRADHELPLLRAYLYDLLQTDAPITLILALRGRVEAIGQNALSPFRLEDNYRLTNLGREETLHLIQKSERMHVFETVADFIFHLTAGHPGDTQRLCHSLFDRHISRGHRQLTMADVVSVLQYDLKPSDFVGRVYRRLDQFMPLGGQMD